MKRRPFYGWLNLAVLWLSYGTVVAAISYAFGVVVNDMADSLGMTMTLATGAYTGYLWFAAYCMHLHIPGFQALGGKHG